MILGKQAIKKAIERKEIVLSPFNPKNLGPNSYDITLANKLFTYKDIYLDSEQNNELIEYKLDKHGKWLLKPGILYLGSTVEHTESHAHVPMVEGRSSIGRLGIRIHATAGFGDCGYIGHWTLEIDVVQPVTIKPGIRIGQIFWHTVEGEIIERYHGKYNNATGVEGSKLFQDK